MRHKLLMAILAGVAAVLSGCATVNPYHDDTMCPSLNDFGQCVNMTEAYEKTLEPLRPKDQEQANAAPVETRAKVESADSSPAKDPEKTYRGQLYTELATLIQAPKTPLLKPPTVRRVLVLSYEDKALFMPRFFYMMVNEGTWTLNELPADEHGAKPVEIFAEHEK